MGSTTHDVAVGPRLVTKRYRSWARGEPHREWRALTLLDEHVPGLAARPLALTEASPPVLEMSVVPGVELGAAALTPPQLDALAAALTRLHGGVPETVVGGLPPRIWAAAELVSHLGEVMADARHDDPTLAAALTAARGWLASTTAAALATIVSPVLAQADGNLANVLWDGSVCRLVDFEDSGLGDRAIELADLVEHVSVTMSGAFRPHDLLDRLDLDSVTRERVRPARTMFAVMWLSMLVPGGVARARNPPGSDVRQAQRVLELIG